jgi:hypothetical protein
MEESALEKAGNIDLPRRFRYEISVDFEPVP